LNFEYKENFIFYFFFCPTDFRTFVIIKLTCRKQLYILHIISNRPYIYFWKINIFFVVQKNQIRAVPEKSMVTTVNNYWSNWIILKKYGKNLFEKRYFHFTIFFNHFVHLTSYKKHIPVVSKSSQVSFVWKSYIF
jgi:hypothetical protein